MLGAYRKAVGVLNHPLMYLAGNYCYRINAIAPLGTGSEWQVDVVDSIY